MPLESRSTGNTDSRSSLIGGGMSLGKIPSFFFLYFSLKKGEQVLVSGSRVYFLALDIDEDPEFN